MPIPRVTLLRVRFIIAAGKTDYRARKRLVAQDKNKYASPRYRLVVRLTNHYVICQIVHSEIEGDRVVAAANSAELERYGLKVGPKNYAAAYATGLLVARRVLTKLGLAELYEGNTEIDGKVVKTEKEGERSGRKRKFYVSAVAEERKPFRCVLDVGIRPTTTGARIFGAMKGAADGGLDIPHNEKRFPGYNRDSKKFDAEAHADRIKGKHISEYMELLVEEDPETFQKRFSKYVDAGLDAEGYTTLIEEVHAAIRADPSAAPKKPYKSPAEFQKKAKRGLEERKAAIAEKKAARAATLRAAVAAGGAADAEEEDDEAEDDE